MPARRSGMMKQVDQAVIILRYQDDHAQALRGLRQPPLRNKSRGDGREVSTEVGEIFLREIDVEVFGIELDAHEEEAGLFVGMPVRMQNVAVVPADEVGDGRDLAFASGQETKSMAEFFMDSVKRVLLPAALQRRGTAGKSAPPHVTSSIPSISRAPHLHRTRQLALHPDASRCRTNIGSQSESGSGPSPAEDAW
jgi:hypothetical protein